jgi:hypothetical protein
MNKDAVELYSQEEIKTDIMRYKTNGISFWLCMLAIVFNVAMFLIIYTTKSCTSDYELGIDLLVNVIFLLAVFLTAEKTKAYNKTAGFCAIGLGVVEIIRIFWIPTKYHNMWLVWNEEAKAVTEALTAQGKTPEEIATSLPILSGLNNGQFTWCIILLVAACLSLVAAGVVAIIKSNKLSAHLAKLEEKAGE